MNSYRLINPSQFTDAFPPIWKKDLELTFRALCKIGFKNVRLYGLHIILSPSISETISTEGVIEFKNTSLIGSATLPWLVMTISLNPGVQRRNLPRKITWPFLGRLLPVFSGQLCPSTCFQEHGDANASQLKEDFCTQCQTKDICSEFSQALFVRVN